MASVLAMGNPLPQIDESTPRLALVEERLGESLANLIADHRAVGTSWRRISLMLRDRTRVDVSPEALRQWHERVSRTVEGGESERVAS